jgi:hypothetical protein
MAENDRDRDEQSPDEANWTDANNWSDVLSNDFEDEFEADVVSLEELEEEDQEHARDRDADGVYDTAHTDGSTTNVQEAMDQGLVYDPPSDPPVLPSDDPGGIEIATGFASSMEEANADEYELPDRVDNQDLDLEEDIRIELHNNSETANLEDVQVRVADGVAWLYGTVMSDEDIAIVEYLVSDIEGVQSVENLLRVAGE